MSGITSSHRLVKSIVLGTAALLAAGLLLLALLGGYQRTAAQPAGDNIHVGIGSFSHDFDPAQAMDLSTWLVSAQIFDTLTSYRPENAYPQPGLAESWDISEDGLVYTFTIRSGINFHDGSPLDATAVVFNIERWWDTGNPYHTGNFDYFYFLFGGFKDEAGCLLSAVSQHENQVVLTLNEPNNSLPAILAIPPFSIASPAAIQAGSLSSTPVGSGAFTFVEYISPTQINLAANLAYWAGSPAPEALTFEIITDEGARYAALEAGSLEAVSDLPGGYALPASGNPDLLVTWRPASLLGYLGINRGHTPLDNPLVRQAIAHAVDRQSLVANLYEPGTTAARQWLPGSLWGYNATVQPYAYDPALAHDLLVQAGYPNGITTTLAYRDVIRGYLPDPSGTAQAIAEDLEAAGFHITVIEYESSEFIEKYSAGELDLFLLGWGADYPHPDNYISPHFCTQTGFGPLDGELCNMLSGALAEDNLAIQLGIYQWASQRIHDTGRAVPLVHVRSLLLTRYDLGGVQVTPLGMDLFAGASLDQGSQGVVDPGSPATIVHTSTSGSSTSLEIPSGAVTETVTLQYIVVQPESAPQGYASAANGFTLNAYRDGALLEGFSFEQPVTLTIQYSQAEVTTIDESSLRVYYWAGSAWQDAAETCLPASIYQRDQAANTLSVRICHLSQFGLFGEQHVLYLPLTPRAP